eukprot:119101_1
MTPEESIIPHFTIIVSNLLYRMQGDDSHLLKYHTQGEQVDLSPLVEEFDLTGDAEAAMDVLQNSAGCENPILRGGGACEADEAACIACLNDSSMSPSQCASFVRALEICASQQVKLRSDPLLQ